LKDAVASETFVKAAIGTNSQQLILEEAALECSFQLLTNVLTEVELGSTVLKQSVKILIVTVPETLSNVQEILTALRLAVCGPKIDWYLLNKALNSLVALTTRHSIRYPDIQSRRLLMKKVWQTDFFMADVTTILRSGDVQMSICLEALNTVISQYKDDLSCSDLFFDPLVDVLWQLKLPAIVQKERLLVHLIARNQSPYIGDDAVRLINDFVYSHKKAIDIASSTL
jgi:hypothetical protein